MRDGVREFLDAVWSALVIAGIVLLALVLWALVSSVKAGDDGDDYGYRVKRLYRICDRWTGHCRREYVWVQAQQRYRPRVLSYVEHDDDRPAHRRRACRTDWRHDGCKPCIRAVGDQHLTVDGAKKAANDGWAGTIRFHYGEKFMDLANARHITYTCSRSSIKEGGVTTLGQTFTRCEIEARPCAPIEEAGEK